MFSSCGVGVVVSSSPFVIAGSCGFVDVDSCASPDSNESSDSVSDRIDPPGCSELSDAWDSADYPNMVVTIVIIISMHEIFMVLPGRVTMRERSLGTGENVASCLSLVFFFA